MAGKNVIFLELTQEILDRGSRLRFKAHGNSMHPFIENGSILLTEPFKNTSNNIGDILFYRRPDNDNVFTAHRFIKIDKRQYGTTLFTKGDALGYYDPPVLPEHVLGRIIQIERKKKRLILTNWPWRIFGLLIACFARGRYYNQGRVVRNLGRLWWLTGGRRIK